MTIYVNGSSVETAAANLQELHAQLQLPQMVGMALNNKVVPRTEWHTTTLADGDKLIIIKVACGG